MHWYTDCNYQIVGRRDGTRINWLYVVRSIRLCVTIGPTSGELYQFIRLQNTLTARENYKTQSVHRSNYQRTAGGCPDCEVSSIPYIRFAMSTLPERGSLGLRVAGITSGVICVTRSVRNRIQANRS